MFIAATFAVILNAPSQAESYKIVDIARQSVFAGKLGDLVHETLTVERDGQRYTITVRGDYHTRCVRPGQRFHEGDMIQFSGSPTASEFSVDRDRISRSRSGS